MVVFVQMVCVLDMIFWKQLDRDFVFYEVDDDVGNML